jgi:hypothetical protein
MCLTPFSGSGFNFIANSGSNGFSELGEVGELGGGDCDIIFILYTVMLIYNYTYYKHFIFFPLQKIIPNALYSFF